MTTAAKGRRAVPAPRSAADPPKIVSWTMLADAMLLRESAALRIESVTAGQVMIDLVSGDREADEVRATFEQAIVEARAAFANALEEPSPFARIVQSARLSPPEAEVLGLLCAVELDVRRQRLVAYLNDDPSRRRPSLATVARLFGHHHPGSLTLAPDARLLRAGLVEVGDHGPWGERVATVHPSVLWALAGDASGDPELPLGVSLAVQPGNDGGVPLMVVSGDDHVRRLQAALAGTAGSRFLVTAAPSSAAGWAATVRQATLGGLGVIVEVDGDLSAEGRDVIERADHLAWAIVSRHELPIDQLPRRSWTAWAAGSEEPTDEEWSDAFGPGVPRSHNLTADQLRLVAIAYPATGGDLDAAVRRLAAGHIDRLARRIRPARTWEDLVLPPDHFAQLKELAARYRNRARVYGSWGFQPNPSAGVVALFAGASGTGKTLAAEILAGDLSLEMYKLDLSAVVSKYIGETEKNLDRVFDAAAAGNVVLFFDEADALFGKRTEVGDAHDRYANVETAYLLQRLEAYNGVVVLATNLASNIDTAFLRRFHAVVEFPVPEPSERRRMWERSLGSGAPLDGVDLDFLADQFVVTGGSIRNAALAAAFLAAELGTGITMETLILALRREFQKLGRLVNPGDFGRYGHLVDQNA